MVHRSSAHIQTDRNPPPEECVTFQVVLIGRDGLVVGSDRRALYVIPIPGQNPIFQRTEQPKYKKNKSESVVCFYAGGADSAQQASDIAHRASLDEDDDSWMENIERQARDSHRMRNDAMNEILVFRKDRPRTAWYVKSVPPETSVSPITTTFCTGIYSDARFLVSRLYEAGLPISKLSDLVLLTLAYAAKDNSGNIGGSFDIMKMDSDGKLKFEHYEQSDLDPPFPAFDKKFRSAFDKFHPVTASTT
jgi:hypothetical protein